MRARFVTSIARIYRPDLEDVQRQRDTRFICYPFGGFGVVAMLLQLFNVVLLGAFWPFSPE
jgi:hypothetical protein